VEATTASVLITAPKRRAHDLAHRSGVEIPAGPTTLQRLRKYLEDVLPGPFAALLKNGLGALAVWALVAFVLVWMQPLLSIVALSAVVKVLPAPASHWVHDNFVAAIQSGYDIDVVREVLKRETSADVLKKLSHNNESLDYVQYVEFYLTKRDRPKNIPARLHIGQRAEIQVQKSEVTQNPNSRDPNCALPDIGPDQAVLSVHLDGLRLLDLPTMHSTGREGQIHLQKKWWDENMKRVLAEPSIASDGIASVVFGKTPALDQAMTECTALKVEATVEVYKQDIAEGA
jgi:hypothetical protein